MVISLTHGGAGKKYGSVKRKKVPSLD